VLRFNERTQHANQEKVVNVSSSSRKQQQQQQQVHYFSSVKRAPKRAIIKNIQKLLGAYMVFNDKLAY
jgi:hypothetical protein